LVVLIATVALADALVAGVGRVVEKTTVVVVDRKTVVVDDLALLEH